MRKRLHDIDRATGLTILLVVIGHIVARQPPAGNEWYVSLKHMLYQFHMPFFMFLSGSIFYYTYKPIKSISDYSRFVRGKAARLLPGFFLFAFLILLGKHLASYFLYVDNFDKGILKGFFTIIIDPVNSASMTLWYIYVFFEYCLIFPLILVIFRNNLIPVIILSAGLYILPHIINIPDMFLMKRFTEFSIFFSIGFLFIKYRRYIIEIIEQYSWLFIMLFIAMIIFEDKMQADRAKILIGLTSIPAIFALIRMVQFNWVNNHLSLLGEYSFSIYLMNTIFIGLGKGVLLKVFPWDGINFYFYFPILLTLGLVTPIYVHKYILQALPYLGKITK